MHATSNSLKVASTLRRLYTSHPKTDPTEQCIYAESHEQSIPGPRQVYTGIDILYYIYIYLFSCQNEMTLAKVVPLMKKEASST